MLDIGAIHGTQYEKHRWIKVTSIDLNALGPNVIQADFFKFPIPPADELYDVVGLSLVINFLGSLEARAEMLRRAHRFLKNGGHLFVVLPLACLSNSRYLDHGRFTGLLKTLGWEPVVQYDSSRLTHWLLKRGKGDSKKWKREEVRGGAKRNNFCIVVK
jgi:25S rRNA (adenine2142-N1)-methyltransferase